MSFTFSGFFSNRPSEIKIAIIIIIFAFVARLFALFFMPDVSMTDSIYHLSIVKYIIANHVIPLAGIPNVSNASLPVPLFHILVAIPFTILPIQFNLATARIFPFIFSFLQLVLAFILLKKLFPKRWPIGFAFVAMQPFLIIFGALNYLETLATVTVLACFLIYLRFAETGKTSYLIAMPFAIAAMALSKESATILVPPFFLAFLFELLKKRGGVELWKKKGRVLWQWTAKTAYFVVASVTLSAVWFFVNAKSQSTSASTTVRGFAAFLTGLQYLSPVLILLLPLQFNASFWFFLAQGFSSNPFGISAELAFVAFSIVTFPVLCLIFFGLAKGVAKKDRASLLLLLCLAFSFFILVVRANRQISVRMLVPIIPLFGISVCWAFKSINGINWRRIALLLFSLTAIYSVAFSSLYVLNFYEDYNNHIPLYEFAKGLPEGSVIAIHPNKTRQLPFITGVQSVSFAYFNDLKQEELIQKLNEYNVTHIAATCYKNPWDLDVLNSLEQQYLLEKVFGDNCSTLYWLKK